MRLHLDAGRYWAHEALMGLGRLVVVATMLVSRIESELLMLARRSTSSSLIALCFWKTNGACWRSVSGK